MRVVLLVLIIVVSLHLFSDGKWVNIKVFDDRAVPVQAVVNANGDTTHLLIQDGFDTTKVVNGYAWLQERQPDSTFVTVDSAEIINGEATLQDPTGIEERPERGGL